jgi:hypothetical protein
MGFFENLLGYLRAHASFKEQWLDGLRFIDGDLAIGEKCIAGAAREDVKTCTSVTTERQITAYWLEGMIYCIPAYVPTPSFRRVEPEVAPRTTC